MDKDAEKKLRERCLFSIPLVIVLCIWLSSLAFVPVPWPDDSAFYFVAKEFFKWPPRWVMIPQAPFEPTYRIFNFNTMPLYPLLIGVGRWIGIDGSFMLKLWPLGAWALSGSVLGVTLYRMGLPFITTVILLLTFSLDPEMRWASVLVRPESLIGFFGTLLVLGITFGFPKKIQQKGLWDPVAALLALAAYSHFNAVHLIFPVVMGVIAQSNTPRALFKTLLGIASRSLLYLSPWILLVLFHWELFIRQMALQWKRLNVPNDWLSTPTQMIHALFDSMGSPHPWPSQVYWASGLMWLILGIAAIVFGISIAQIGLNQKRKKKSEPSSFSLLPAAAWVLSACWLWHTKPEVWFKYYIHLSVWTFCGISALWLTKNSVRGFRPLRKLALQSWAVILGGIAAVFLSVDVSQAIQLSQETSWNWKTYTEFVDCVDQRLTQLEAKVKHSTPFQVWCPTFPDITIELSRRHPDWEFSRTDDFYERWDAGVRHGWSVPAVVVTETLRSEERTLSGDAGQFPGLQSVWMTWNGYYLVRLYQSPHWKPNRYVCQRGRWQAFLFMDEEKQTEK